ncbi:unnamed protein product [Linum trigynum]|uniref:Uncharacterized protein n=2 Tax=Linum trigynum TaxID=586398 RepID=A0AAV2FKI8_9ROSI
MGCASSKLDDLPAVALCRERCTFLNEAITQRFLLAEAHLGYVYSLRGVADSLHHFMEQDFGAGGGGGLGSPKLNLPPKGKGVSVEDGGNSPKKVSGGGRGHGHSHSHSHSHSGSHLHFIPDSDEEDEDDDDDSDSHLHLSDHSSPLHSHAAAAGGGGGKHVEYMGSEYMPMSVDQSSFPGGGYPGGGVGYPGGGVGYPGGGAGYPGSGGVYPGGGGGYPGGGGGYPATGGGYPGGGGGFFQMNYMKKKGTASVVYQQRPAAAETVRFGESSSSSSYYSQANNNPPYPVDNSSAYSYFGYPNYTGGSTSGAAGYYGAPPAYGSSSPPPQIQGASSSKPPPAPPSPPRASAWDFLNPFESGETFYPSYTPSRDSREVREEEGIPDLEDEDYQHEVVKEVHGDPKYAAESSGSSGDVGHSNYTKSAMIDDDEMEAKPSTSGGGGGGEAEASLYQTRASGVSMETDGPEYEVHVVEKKVVGKEKPDEHGNGAGSKGRGGWRDVSQVAIEIKIQFERASEYGNEMAKMLEVGKLPYQRKHVSKKLHGVTPSSLSLIASQPPASNSLEASSSNDNALPSFLEMDEDLAVRSKNLSSTLQKLYLWEKKLYTEVKAEEKMRVVHDRKCRKLKRLDERGAEAHKIDATRTLIRSLSTKIRIAIQVVDKISVTINKIRDEELWPQLNDLILGLSRMWKNMLQCHEIQCQAIKEAKGFGPMGSAKKLSDDHLQATLQLEHQLLNWTSGFTSWVGAQKGYVKALNNWLVKCLLYEPEETPDGVAPFSPGRMGAPPVFVICNQWAQAIDRISEKEVVDSMRLFASTVFKLWEHDKEEMRSRMMTNKDLERKVRNLDREDQKIQKEIQALDKKIVLVSGDGGDGLSVTGNVVYQSDTSNGSLQGSLQRIFEAMEKFTAESVKAYEDLVQRSEEESRAGEHGTAS